MTTLPPKHRWVETEDGSKTLFSETFGEACHSSSGAVTETQLHYIKGCAIAERLPSTILEVGFGLGIGFLETLKTYDKRPFHFISLEIDRDLVNWFALQHTQLKWVDDSTMEGIINNATLTILVGDARKTLLSYVRDHSWQAIYQDAFSPKRNPILWTKEWFSFLRKHSSEDVIMSTYSASSSVRKSMIEAGWKLSKGEKFGPKRTSTRARLSGFTDPEILMHLERSPVKALSDDNIEEYLKQ